jgi:beta-N-acetylglucosaminidase
MAFMLTTSTNVKGILAGSMNETIVYKNPSVTTTDLFMVKEDTVIDSNYKKEYKKTGEFVLLDSTKEDVHKDIVKVDESIKANSFNVKLNGRDDFGNEIKIYSAPHEKTELSTTYERPETLLITDMNIYNQKFFKVENDGYTFYVDMNTSKWEPYTKEEFKIIGNTDFAQVIPSVVNLTMDIAERTNLKYEDIYKITAGTGLEGIEHAVIKAEETYGVNSLFILSVAVQETGWGWSYLAQERNNLFGICAYDSNTDAATDFESKEQCVMEFADLIASEYFERGLTTPYLINTRYASDESWCTKVESNMSSMMAEI